MDSSGDRRVFHCAYIASTGLVPYPGNRFGRTLCQRIRSEASEFHELIYIGDISDRHLARKALFKTILFLVFLYLIPRHGIDLFGSRRGFRDADPDIRRSGGIDARVEYGRPLVSSTELC